MATIETTVNIRAASYHLVTTARACWRCGVSTPVYGFVLPAGHEVLQLDEDDAALDYWESADYPSLLSYIGYLTPPVVARISARAPHYRLRFSTTTALRYWMNGCEHCGAKLGDFFIFEEPGQGFLPFTAEQARQITVARVTEPFAAFCHSWSVGIELYEFMRRS